MVSKKNIIYKLYLYLMIIFFYAPIVVLVIYSFNKSKSQVKWSGFSFDWYIKLLDNDQIKDAFFVTISIALISTIISTILGTFAAIGIHNLTKRQRKLVLNVNYIPILNPDIVTGVSLMVLFLSFGFIIDMGYLTMLIAHIIFSIPFVVLAVLPKLYQMNPNMLEAALDLGATPLIAIRKVLIPELKPGIITGALIAFTMSIDDFVISYFTTGNGVSNLAIEIYTMTRRGVNPEANALFTIMIIIIFTLMIVIARRVNMQYKRRNK